MMDPEFVANVFLLHPMRVKNGCQRVMKTLNMHSTVNGLVLNVFYQKCKTRSEKPEFSVLKAELTFFSGTIRPDLIYMCHHSICESDNQYQRATFSLPKT